MKQIRWGIVGAGDIAKKFAKACHENEDTCLCAVASTNAARANAFAQDNNISKAYGCYADLLADDEIDAVYIATINTLHFSAIEQCAKAGKAILCEKPCVMTQADAQKVASLARKYNVLIMEAVWSLFLPATHKVQQWLNNMQIGRVRCMEANFSFYSNAGVDSRLFSKALGGGGIFDVGVY